MVRGTVLGHKKQGECFPMDEIMTYLRKKYTYPSIAIDTKGLVNIYNFGEPVEDYNSVSDLLKEIRK
jgi:hypothetical protein